MNGRRVMFRGVQLTPEQAAACARILDAHEIEPMRATDLDIELRRAMARAGCPFVEPDDDEPEKGGTA